MHLVHKDPYQGLVKIVQYRLCDVTLLPLPLSLSLTHTHTHITECNLAFMLALVPGLLPGN